MNTLGVNVAILERGQVLLTRREDFEVWCLPGGSVDEHESVAQAAVREAREETGLEVELTRLVGIYSRPNWRADGTHIVLFAARIVGGELNVDPHEVLEARFFPPDALPEALFLGNRLRIADAFAGAVGAAWAQNEAWPFAPEDARREIYEQRDASGLSRLGFYQATYGRLESAGETLEVPPCLPPGAEEPR